MVTKKKAAVKKPKRRKSRRAKRGTYMSQKGGQVNYRSNWEFEFAQWLDTNPEVVSFEYEKLVIPYLSSARSKKMRKYYPDFAVTYTDGRLEILEIKPARKVHQIRNMKKSVAAADWARQNGATYKIITEVELRALGLLKKKPS